MYTTQTLTLQMSQSDQWHISSPWTQISVYKHINRGKLPTKHTHTADTALLSWHYKHTVLLRAADLSEKGESQRWEAVGEKESIDSWEVHQTSLHGRNTRTSEGLKTVSTTILAKNDIVHCATVHLPLGVWRKGESPQKHVPHFHKTAM